jgi:hypothetical protein
MKNITSELKHELNNNINNNNPSSFLDTVIIIFNYCWDVGYVILPSVGYIHQYMKIVSLKRTEGFSKVISFILIISYIFRTFFWIGKPFEKSILFNGIFGIIVQLLLLRVCLKYDTRLQKNESISRFLNLKEFWNWPYFGDYLFFVFFISSLITIVSLMIGYNNKYYVFLLGVITSTIESFCDVPQIYELYISKNPYTVSYLLISMWLSGDLFKVSYFFCRDTPIQLILCSIFQLTTDIILSSQIIYYRYFCYNRIDNNDNPDEDNKSNINELSKTINRDLFNNYDNNIGISGNLKISDNKEINT